MPKNVNRDLIEQKVEIESTENINQEYFQSDIKVELTEVIICFQRSDPSRNKQCPRYLAMPNPRTYSQHYVSPQDHPNNLNKRDLIVDDVMITDRQVQKKFKKHAEQFGILGMNTRENSDS